MRICFDHGDCVDFELQGPTAPVLVKMYRHLQHVPLAFRDWDNPFCQYEPTPQLVQFARIVGVEVDANLCSQQHYLNHLHEIYERNYNGDSRWLDFHEHIHMHEKRTSGKIILDHRELAGQVQQKFHSKWLEHAVTDVAAGTVFVECAELGKSPYNYWRDGEPDSLDRLCQLAKPWISLRSKLAIAVRPLNFTQHLAIDQFQDWWKTRSSDWCQHWGIASWTIQNQKSVIPVGCLDSDSLQNMINWLQQGHRPLHVRL
jgi:hypothetical protein